jgi:hypothetical protein
MMAKIDGFVKSPFHLILVIPAKLVLAKAGSENPFHSGSSGLLLSQEWRLFRLFTSSSRLTLNK